MANNVTLSLCMICGSGEAFELERCLKSARRDLEGEPRLFDEVVLGVNYPAGKEIDQEVLAVANKYATKIITFEWESDFGGARNKTFDAATSGWLMWLDSDDIIKPENYKKFLDLKPFLINYDVILAPYIYAHNKETDATVITLPRERIVRNIPEIRWIDPIHECMNITQLDPTKPPFRAKEENIPIDHYRVKGFDPSRNLTILEKEYNKPNCSARIKFYYGKDLAESGFWDKSLPILTDLINSGEGYQDNLAVACVKVAGHYLEKGNLDLVKHFSFKGIGFSGKYAEFFLNLGDIFHKEGDVETAIRYFQEALTKKLDAGMSQMPDYYKFLPADRLSLIFYGKRDLEKALCYNTMTLECYPNDERVLKNRESILREMASLEVLIPKNVVIELETFVTSKGFDFQLIHNFPNSADIKILKSEVIAPEVCWLIPIVNIADPSVRIRRFNVHNKMNELGTKSTIIQNYYPTSIGKTIEKIGSANVVIFTQFSEYDWELMKRLKAKGKKLAFDHNEALFNFSFEAECMSEVDTVVCCSTKLAEITNQHGHTNTSVVKDALEEISVPPMVYANPTKPKAVWCGMGGNSFLVTEVLKEAIQKAGYDLLVISEWDYPKDSWFEHKKWDINTWVKGMMACDVVLCPQRENVQPGKSNIKATQALALGMPVVASKILSYTEVVQHGKNGYLASIQSPQEWQDALVELKDLDKRKAIGTEGAKSVGAYTLEAVTKDWVNLCRGLLKSKVTKTRAVASPQKKQMKQVDLIIANYNNVEYLKLLISSIKLNTTHPHNIIISDAGSNAETWEYLNTLKGFTVLGKKGERLNFSQAVNAGVLVSNTELFVVMNSDLIVSRGWLEALVEKMETVDRLGACGPLSNCDNGFLHNFPGGPQFDMTLENSGLTLHPGMKIGEVTPHLQDLYSFMEKQNVINKGGYQRQDWVAYYCTIFARSAWNEVSGLSPEYNNGCEDLDHCYNRLRKSGFEIGRALGSWVFHFGGVSRGHYQQENKDAYDKEDVRNHEIYAKKWYTDSSRQTARKKIAIWTGASHEDWNRDAVDSGMAGSETWAAELAAEFSRRGYQVTIFNQCVTDGEIDRDGVTYRDYTKIHEAIAYDYLDVFISSRTCEPLSWSLHSSLIYIMVHDIWLSGDPNYDLRDWRVSKYAYLSDWHKAFLLQHHKGMNPNKMMLTMNGVNRDLYTVAVEKKNQTVYSSSADRGLRELLLMLPEIRKAVPDFSILIFYGFLNWESAAKARNNPAELHEIETIKELMKQPGVEYHGRVDKKTLAKYQMESKVWLFPTFFQETHCVTAVENSISKNAILSSNLAGLKTTVGDSGILLDGFAEYGGSHPQAYKDKFIAESIKLLTDEEYRLSWAEKAYQKAQQYTWKNCADGWVKEFGW